MLLINTWFKKENNHYVLNKIAKMQKKYKKIKIRKNQ